jgi:acyl-CoA thioester hydrolase
MYHSETILPVRYAETDQMGIVHHSVYPVWFECGRTDYIQHYGLSYFEVERSGALLPLLKLTCEYFYPARYGEMIIIDTRMLKATNTRLSFGYEVRIQGSNTLCAKGVTDHAWTSLEMRPVNLAKFNPTLFKRLKPMYDSSLETI